MRSIALWAIVGTLGLMLGACPSGDEGGSTGSAVDGAASARDGALPVKLYFPGPGDVLYPELTQVPFAEGLEERIAATLAALLSGPQDEALSPVFATEVTVGSVFVNDRGVCFVDLTAAGESRPPVYGSRQEIVVAYSVVDTVLLNFPDVRSVALMWNGEQGSSFAGHLDTTRPLLANTDLVSESSIGESR